MAITKLTEYNAAMSLWLGLLEDSLEGGSPLGDEQKLANTYYDAQQAFYRSNVYQSGTTWNTAMGLAQSAYGTYYVDANNGNVPGYWSFTHGLLNDYLLNSDTAARASLRLLRDNAAYHATGDTSDDLLSRENAYALNAYINATLLGDSPNTARIDTLFNNAMGHIEQWCTLLTADYFRPFMGAITARALINYYENYDQDSQIITYLATMEQYQHDECLNIGQSVWNYTDRDVGSTDPTDLDPQPDLGMLILPYLGWLWTKTWDTKYLTRGDAAFDACVPIYDQYGFWVSGAYLGGQSAASVNGKHVCQNFVWSQDYLVYRAQTQPSGGGAISSSRGMKRVGR